jgi:hypothetical protein
MKATVRRCVQCGRNDTRQMWSSIDQAADDGALLSWTCPNCAWTEADLVEVEAPVTGASGDPLAPVDPDEARHAVAGPPRSV